MAKGVIRSFYFLPAFFSLPFLFLIILFLFFLSSYFLSIRLLDQLWYGTPGERDRSYSRSTILAGSR